MENTNNTPKLSWFIYALSGRSVTKDILADNQPEIDYAWAKMGRKAARRWRSENPY